MKIKIKILTNEPNINNGFISYEGEIQIGDFKETFIIPIGMWRLDQYLKQWHEGLERIKIKRQSCLITQASGKNGISGYDVAII